MSSQFTPLTAKRHPSRTLWKCFFANLSWSVRFSSHIFGPVFALALLVQILDICHVLKFYFFFALLKKGCSVRACLRCTLPSWQLRGKARLSSIRIDPLPSISPLQPTICLGKRKRHSHENGALIQKSLPHDTKYISLDPNQKGLGWNLNGVSQIMNDTNCSAFCGLQSLYLSSSAVEG